MMRGFRGFILVGVLWGLTGCETREEREGPGRREAGLSTPRLDLTVESVVLEPRVVPGGSLAVTVTATNRGTATWEPGDTRLAFRGDAAWSNGTLALGARTRPGQRATFTGRLAAPRRVGLFPLSWTATFQGTAFGAAIPGHTEVTCSDGVFCNGDERWVNGRCIAGSDPCDDGAECTVDVCDEAAGLCDHVLGGPECEACFAKNCNPHCRGAVCGDDGCGGSCGSCAPGEACLSGACSVANQPGTCSQPLPLVAAGTPLLGDHVLTGDTTGGLNEVVPSCNSTSTAREVIYTFTVTETVGIDARSSGFDTVLHLRKGDCGAAAATVGCSDDAAPPGDYGSRVAALLTPGTYYLIVDGFDSASFGAYTLNIRFAAGCVPQCDGRFCGGTDGCGGTCGTCPEGEECNTAGRCVSSPCQPDCNGRKCGDDGCGGTCGTCADGQLCVVETGACKSFPTCDHARPVCATPCSTNEFCGTDCQCHRRRDPMADLVVDRARLMNEIRFDTVNISPDSCAIAEACVRGSGPRQLLRFSVEAVNQGQATLTVPPAKARPDLFQYSPCHGHYHFSGFASYALLDLEGRVVLPGQKLAYCMEDTVQARVGPNVACTKKYDCENQGIQAGWSDLYGNALDCQWLDITGIPSGRYQLQVSVNPARTFEEISFDNNVTTIPVDIP